MVEAMGGVDWAQKQRHGSKKERKLLVMGQVGLGGGGFWWNGAFKIESEILRTFLASWLNYLGPL